ncbi:MAG: hypothetical protein ACOCU8_01860 [Patescibacteria group bacterium]
MKNIIGYIFLGLIWLLSFYCYSRGNLTFYSFDRDIFVLASVVAIMAVTVNVFWLKNGRWLRWWQERLGPVGYVLNCGYCLSLWLAVVAVGYLRIVFIPFRHLDFIWQFILSWLALGFVAVFLFELLAILCSIREKRTKS